MGDRAMAFLDETSPQWKIALVQSVKVSALNPTREGVYRNALRSAEQSMIHWIVVDVNELRKFNSRWLREREFFE